MISERTIGRLSIYRRILEQMQDAGRLNVFSHELAEMAGCSPAQVRRDLMVLNDDGTPSRGYNVEQFLDSLNEYLAGSKDQGVGLVGIGNLGRALLAYFAGRRTRLSAVAAFDRDPEMTGRVIHGCRCYPMEQLAETIQSAKIDVIVLAVPANEAQNVADQIIQMGIRGILNFAPVPIQAPGDVYVENMDMRMALEKVAFFAHRQAQRKAAQSIGDV